MADLQELVDDLAAEIGRPISVEDRRWRLLAHSAHDGEIDAVRRTTILARAAPPAVASWLESLGVLRAAGLTAVPANAGLGMAARVCVPVRHGDVLLGFVWVVVAERPLAADEEAALLRAAQTVQEVLWARRTQQDEQAHLVRTLLEDDDAAAARHAALELGALLRVGDGAPVAVAVADADVGEDVGERLRRRWPRGGAVAWVARGGGLVALGALPAQGAAPLAPAQALVDAGAVRAAAGATATGLAGARAALRQAELALLVARAAPDLGAAVCWEALGGWALVADLWDRAGRPGPPEPVARLLAHRSAPELVEALESVLETAGDMTAAAERLHLHRATLYRRLERVETITGLDCAAGDDRLQLQLGLRLHRLHQGARP